MRSASLALLVLALVVAAVFGPGGVAAKTKYVMNLDHNTFWKVIRQGRLVIVKFDVEHPHGIRQDNWVELAEQVALSPAAADVLIGEIRIKDSDSEPGGRSPNIPLWDYFNFSLIAPPHLVALIPNGRIDWARNHSQQINIQGDDEFDLTFNMTPAHQFHQGLRADFGVNQTYRTQFTANLGARWINAILRQYPDLDKLNPKTKYPLDDAKPLPRHVLRDNQTLQAGLGYVSFRGLPHERCQLLASGETGWRTVLAQLETEVTARMAFLAEKARVEKAQDELLALEAAGDDEVAAKQRVQEIKELQRVENTNDGRRQRAEATRQARLHRERTWLIDVLRKMLGVKRCPAKEVPESRHGSNDDPAARLEEERTCAAAVAASDASATVFDSAERVAAEEVKLRFVARSPWLSLFTRLRADFQLGALWCAKRHFLFGAEA